MDYKKTQIYHHIDKPFCDKNKHKKNTPHEINYYEPHTNISSYMLYGGIALFIIYLMRKK